MCIGSQNNIHLLPQTINILLKMKKSFLTFTVIALVLSLTSCKETNARTTEETTVEVLETTIEVPAAEVPVEGVLDSTSTSGTVVKDNTNITSEE